MSNSLKDGIRIFEAIAASPGCKASISALSGTLSLSYSKIHRLLLTLCALGYVEQEKKSGLYRITNRAWVLTSRSITDSKIMRMANRRMNDLYDSFGLNVHLSILDGFESVYLYIVSGKGYVENYSQVGGRAPAVVSATGKILISRSSLEYLTNCYSYCSEHYEILIEFSEFCEQMTQVRRSGIAYNYGMLRKDIWGVATPIFDGVGRVTAALGVSGHRSTYGDYVSENLEDHLRQAATLIKEDIYGSSPISIWF